MGPSELQVPIEGSRCHALFPPHACRSYLMDRQDRSVSSSQSGPPARDCFRIRSLNDGGHWTLQLDGELDLSNSSLLNDELALAETSAETITVDLGGLTFMDSSGLHVLTYAQARSGSGGWLRLRKGPRAVQRVFRLTDTEDRLPFVG